MSTRAGRSRAGGRTPRRRPRIGIPAHGRWRPVASRLIPVLFAVLAVVGTFAAILLMTVRITDGQYRLVDLHRQEQALQQESESLTQDLEFHQAPQNLARSARDEGLVPAPSQQGVVDLTTGEVSGQAEPAAEADGEEVDIAIPPPVQTGSSAADAAAQEARARRDALPSSDDDARDQLERARDAEDDVDLHGGSIPAPQQRPGSTGASDARDDASAAPTGEAAPADGNPEAPRGHTPLSGPAETPQAPAPVDADDAAGAGAATGAGAGGAQGTAQDGTAQEDGTAQDGTGQEGAGR